MVRRDFKIPAMVNRKKMRAVACGLFFLLLTQACFQPATPTKVKEEFFAAYEKDERPVDLTFRMIDQDGQGARNLRFKVDLSRLHRFLGLIRYTREECHEVTTDENGLVRIVIPGKKASYISFKEVEVDSYVFSKGLRNLGEVSMGKFTDVPRPIQLKVVRHGPSQKLLEFHPHSITVPAADKNVFSLTLADGKIKNESSTGQIIINVNHAKQACEAYAETLQRPTAGGTLSLRPNVEVQVSGQAGLSFREADDDFVSFAPADGYVERLVKGGEISREWSPCRFFVRTGQGQFYYWFSVEVNYNSSGDLFLSLEGRTNPTGSNNLYRDVWPYKDEFKRYSERCP